ncbi:MULTISPECIES: hypothetical protein [unclassified Streptomyces]|uniref:hypothetical protein n=1 Tax=unclassified Streptomyces TaxID=2593676 RepID=UPI0036CA3715
MDVTGTQLRATRLLGAESRYEEMRGARFAALQTVLTRASAEENLKRTPVFHGVIKEAEAFAAGLPGVGGEVVHNA